MSIYTVGYVVVGLSVLLALVAVASSHLALRQRRTRAQVLFVLYETWWMSPDPGAAELSSLPIRDILRDAYGRRSWGAPYVELHQLEEEGLITSRPHPEDAGQQFSRRLYRITEKGRLAVQEGTHGSR